MLDAIRSYVAQHESQFVKLLMDYTNQPSLATDPEGITRCVEFIRTVMEDAGITTQVLPSAGNPMVYGELRAEREDAPTILFYGHYDVQPPDPIEAWTTPPFQADKRDGRVYGRGVGDNKGQHLAHILAVKAFFDLGGGKPSAHLKFILEGEEEIGSGSLPGFALAHRELLKADIVYVSDGQIHETDVQTVCFGNRGVFNFGIEVCTASTDNHSGNKGGVIHNAAWELVHLLSTMTDANGQITIDGFCDEALPSTDFENELMDRLPYDPEETARVFGVEKIDLSKREYYERLYFRPTLSINALGSGSPDETKNIIPGKAVAKLDIRLVAHQEPEHVFARVKAHVEAQKVNGTVRVFHEGDDMYPSKTDVSLPICRRLVEIVEQACGREIIVLPGSGGSVPSSVWTVTLDMPAVLVPYGNADENNHAPDENLRIDCFLQGIITTALVIAQLGLEA